MASSTSVPSEAAGRNRFKPIFQRPILEKRDAGAEHILGGIDEVCLTKLKQRFDDDLMQWVANFHSLRYGIRFNQGFDKCIHPCP